MRRAEAICTIPITQLGRSKAAPGIAQFSQPPNSQITAGKLEVCKNNPTVFHMSLKCQSRSYMKPAAPNLVQDADGGAGAAGCVPLPRGMSGGLCLCAGLPQRGAGLGAGLGTAVPLCLPPTLTPLLSAIYSEFIFYTRRHLQLSRSSPLGEETPSAGSMDSSPAAPRLCQVLGGSRDTPVTLGWAGGGVILFCSLEMPPMCVPLQLGLDGGVFSIWPERGLPNESQVNNTFFKKNLFKCQH